MKYVLAVLAMCLCLAGCSKADKNPKTQANDNSSGNPATAPVDYLGAVNKGRKKGISQVGLLQVNSALSTFQASESRPAKSLQELIAAGYLRVLPELPLGMKWQYNPQTGKASIVPAQ